MTIARLQALITLFWLGTALAWIAVHRAHPTQAMMGVAGIAWFHAGVLALEFLIQRRVSRGDPSPPATGRQLWRAWWREAQVVPRVFCHWQPFCSRRFPDQLGPSHRGQRGVVLVHGYACNRGVWQLWLARLHRQGRPFIAVDLAPAFGDIDQYVALIEDAVARMTAATGLPPLLVGHSMGGMALRAWLRAARSPARAHRLVTLGSPHQGTWMARFGHTRNARQLRPDDPWLKTLNRSVEPGWSRYFVCFYSNADNMVFPPRCATWPGADNRLLQGMAHVQMLMEPTVIDAVLELLHAPPRPDGPVQPSSPVLPQAFAAPQQGLQA